MDNAEVSAQAAVANRSVAFRNHLALASGSKRLPSFGIVSGVLSAVAMAQAVPRLIAAVCALRSCRSLSYWRWSR